VVAVAVGLDHDALLSPEEIDAERSDLRIDLRGGNAVALAEAEEATLELAAGVIRGLVLDGESQDRRLTFRLTEGYGGD
jgi:hypothetical protein